MIGIRNGPDAHAIVERIGRAWRRARTSGLAGLATLMALGALAASAGAAPLAERVVLSVGHTDAVAPSYEDGQLQVQVKDDTHPGAPIFREPDEVLFHAKPEAMTPLPPPGELHPNWEFMRELGDPLWILPQHQDQELLWPGWSGEEIPLGTFVDDALTWTLHEVRGVGDSPPPGEFALWVDDLLEVAEMPFNTTDGLPDAGTMGTDTHTHFNWGFGAEGLYRFIFEVEGDPVGGETVATGPVEYLFFVGELDGLPAATLNLRARPRRAALRPREAAQFTAIARNTGDAVASRVRLCVRVPKRKLRIMGRACRTAAALEAGSAFKPKFPVKAKSRARGKRAPVRFVAASPDADRRRVKTTIRVKRQ